jgi:hypothetical protein
VTKLIVISGAQTGVDQAALRAARACGVATAGWAPLGYMTEDGPATWLADYGLAECPEHGYPARTRLNVAMADKLLWYGPGGSPGFRLTMNEAFKKWSAVGGLAYHVEEGADVGQVVDFVSHGLKEFASAKLMVAGSRESRHPGIGARAEAWLTEFFRLLLGRRGV